MYTEETLTAEAIATIKGQFGSELRAVTTSLGIIVFRKPTREEWDRWQDKNLLGKENASRDARELCQSCLAGNCTTPDMLACLDAQPGLLQGPFMNAVAAMAGLKDESEVKKL